MEKLINKSAFSKGKKEMKGKGHWLSVLLLSLAPVSAFAGTVNLAWDSVEGATHYKVMEDATDDDTDNYTHEYIAGTNSLSLYGKANGKYSYKVIACIEESVTLVKICEGISEYSAPYTATINELNDESWGELGDTEVINAAFVDVTAPDNANFGAIPGQASVSGGQASYSMPIKMAPGRNGMQPNVSLNYSSSGGNGVAGVGWSLSAYSSISRCPSTWAQDSKVRGVQLDASDKLCLNGQRLMAVSGNYGADGTVYRTELDSFAKVTQAGSLGSSGVSFTVLSKDGSLSTYGINRDGTFTDASVTPTGAAVELSWLLTTTKDVSGKNDIVYSYNSHGDGEVLLDKILYTGDGNNNGDRFVSFGYENRSDVRTSYLAGGKTRLTKRLKSVTSGKGTSSYFLYTLTNGYSRNSGRSIVKSIKMCFDGAVNCLGETTFNWHDEAATFKLEKLSYIDGTNTRTFSDTDYELANIMPRGDINGDGVRDWPGVFVNAEGELRNTTSKILENCQQNYLSFSQSCLDTDFNRDGLTDSWAISNGKMLLQITQQNSTNTTNITTNVSITSKTLGGNTDHVKHVADYNGDGWPDLMVHEHNNNSPSIRYYQHSGNMATPYSSNGTVIFNYAMRQNGQSQAFKVNDIQFMGDMDGNGLPDMVITDSYIEHWENAIPQPYPTLLLLTDVGSGTTFTEAAFTSEGTPVSAGLEGPNVHFFNFFSTFVDVNGDGLADVVGWFSGSSTLQVMFNKGNADFTQALNLSGVTLAKRSYKVFESSDTAVFEFTVPKYLNGLKVADINLDGKPELLLPGSRLVVGCNENLEVGGSRTRCGDELYEDVTDQEFSQTTAMIDAAKKDDSIYQFNAIYFDEAIAGTFSVREDATEFVGSAAESAFVDAFGKGLNDFVFAYGPRLAASSIDTSTGTGSVMEGKDFGYYIIRNYGAGGATSRYDYEPQDMIKSSVDGQGIVSQWDYRPLSSDEYDVKENNVVVDEYYSSVDGYSQGISRSQGEYLSFASSMYTVAAFNQTNGVGSDNQVRYRYAGAVYNMQGRGFQGFREIHVEDEASQSLAVTEFHQQFPFTGRVEKQRAFAVVSTTDRRKISGDGKYLGAQYGPLKLILALIT